MNDYIKSIEKNKLIKDPKISINQKGFDDPRHPEVSCPPEYTGPREQRALQMCVEVYKDYTRESIMWWSTNMQRIWKIGKDEVNDRKEKK
jgi:hypothetical protein